MKTLIYACHDWKRSIPDESNVPLNKIHHEGKINLHDKQFKSTEISLIFTEKFSYLRESGSLLQT